jgi:hypothetical protein
LPHRPCVPQRCRLLLAPVSVDLTCGYLLRQHLLTVAGAGISLAAACGSHVVVACGSSLSCLAISCCSGALQQVGGCELQQQASALALLRMSGEPQMLLLVVQDGQHGWRQ